MVPASEGTDRVVGNWNLPVIPVAQETPYRLTVAPLAPTGPVLLALESPALFASLSGSVEYGLGLVRYQPLGMHPNLSGLVYGGGALLFFQRYLAAHRTTQKAFALAMVVLCLCVLLAASARAGKGSSSRSSYQTSNWDKSLS